MELFITSNFYFMFMCRYFACTYLYHHGGQKREMDFLELELWMLFATPSGCWEGIHIQWESSCLFLTMTCFSSPQKLLWEVMLQCSIRTSSCIFFLLFLDNSSKATKQIYNMWPEFIGFIIRSSELLTYIPKRINLNKEICLHLFSHFPFDLETEDNWIICWNSGVGGDDINLAWCNHSTQFLYWEKRHSLLYHSIPSNI